MDKFPPKFHLALNCFQRLSYNIPPFQSLQLEARSCSSYALSLHRSDHTNLKRSHTTDKPGQRSTCSFRYSDHSSFRRHLSVWPRVDGSGWSSTIDSILATREATTVHQGVEILPSRRLGPGFGPVKKPSGGNCPSWAHENSSRGGCPCQGSQECFWVQGSKPFTGSELK